MFQKIKNGSVGAAIALAVVVGGYSAKQLVDSGAAVGTLADRNGSLQAKAKASTGVRVTPFFGPFGYHKRFNGKPMKECGPAVRLMEGALRRLPKPVRTAKAQNCVGLATQNQIKTFQRRIHYKPTGIYNLATHKMLVKRGGYNAAARRDLHFIAHQIYLGKVYHAVLTATSHAFLVGGRLPYSQGGGRSYFPPWPRIPPGTDCSGYSTWVLWQAGVGPAVAYFGPGSAVGWTGTLSQQGTHVANNGPLKVGDLIFYGWGRPWGHVAVYIGHNKVSSHGSVGIKTLPYNYRPVGEVRRYIS